MTYTSNRNMPLIYQGTDTHPVVTAENYEKWYNLYIVYPDKRVEQVPAHIIMTICDDAKEALWVDHLFHPKLLLLLAKYCGGGVDIITLEAAAGRWVMSDPCSKKIPMGYFLV